MKLNQIYSPAPLDLPLDLIYEIETFLTIEDLLTLSIVSLKWWKYFYFNNHFKAIFLKRWGIQLEFHHSKEFESIEFSHSFLSHMSKVPLWGTIEAAFLGETPLWIKNNQRRHLYSERLEIFNENGNNEILNVKNMKEIQPKSLLERLFLLIQPAHLSKKKIYENMKKYKNIHNLNIQHKENFYIENRIELIYKDHFLLRKANYHWKLACVLQEKGMKIIRCKICNKIDILTSQMAVYESISTQCPTWILPCSCKTPVHRTCLEKSLSPVLNKLKWITFDYPNHVFTIELKKLRKYNRNTYTQSNILGNCNECNTNYHPDFRLPVAFKELIYMSYYDDLAWKRVYKSLYITSLLYILVLFLEGLSHNNKIFVWPKESGLTLAWWLFQQVILLTIFFSPRFLGVVNQLWRGPIFNFYTRLYAYFCIACILIVLTHTPILLRHFPFVFGYNTKEFPLWFKIIGIINSLLYFGVSAVIICIFWKTNYRILTVSDRRGLFHGTHPLVSY